MVNQIGHYCCHTIKEVIAASYHENPAVRWRIAWTLGQTHHPRAFSRLVSLTRDPDGAVAYEALSALGTLGDRRAITVLIHRINQPLGRHGADNAAANALSKLEKGSFQP